MTIEAGEMVERAHEARQRGDRIAALAHFQAAAEADPDNIGVRLEIGHDLRELGRFEDAEAAFRGVVERVPTHVGALAALGHLARGRGDRATSLAQFEAAAADALSPE